MKIHKSFSKLELVEIFKNLDPNFIIDKTLNKKDVIEFITKNIKKMNIVNKDNNYKITSIKELKIFLKNENADKKLSVKDKNNVVLDAKRIINYCNNDYKIEKSTFNNFEELEKVAIYIKEYSYISSVRKAINLLNLDMKLKNKIEFNKLDDVKTIKPQYYCKIRTGIFRYDMINCKLEVIEEY